MFVWNQCWPDSHNKSGSSFIEDIGLPERGVSPRCCKSGNSVNRFTTFASPFLSQPAPLLWKGAWAFMDSRAFRVSMGWAYHLDFHMAESLSAPSHMSMSFSRMRKFLFTRAPPLALDCFHELHSVETLGALLMDPLEAPSAQSWRVARAWSFMPSASRPPCRM